MSIKYQVELYSTNNIRLYINFHGIDSNDTTTKENLSLTIYAFDSNYNHVFSETLQYEHIKKLYDHLNSVSLLREDGDSENCKFIGLTEDLKKTLDELKDINSKFLKELLGRVEKDEKLKLMLDSLSADEIENIHATIKQTSNQRSLANLGQLLELEEKSNLTEAIKSHLNLSEYCAKQPEKIFQNWIEKNLWALGIDYVKKHPSRKIGIDSESDMIMETTDGFIDLIELKRPKFELFQFDTSHKCYYPSKELSKVLGQCLKYLKVMDEYKLQIEKEYKCKLLRPRIKIIVGRSNNFNDEQFETLRMLNSNFQHIEVITFDHLYSCGENIISSYNEQSGYSQLIRA